MVRHPDKSTHEGASRRRSGDRRGRPIPRAVPSAETSTETSAERRGTARRTSLAGWVLAVMLAASVAHGLGGLGSAGLAGLAAWLAAALLWGDLAAGQRRQCAVLAGVGLAGIGGAEAAGVDVSLTRLLVQNQAILAMIAGVSFVHLATPAASSHEPASPSGPRAFLRTLVGLNLLAAAINITALLLVSERVARDKPLGRLEAAAFSRTFSLAVLYSPFIGGMALALNQAPEASLATVACFGAVLAACGVAFTWLAARSTARDELEGFIGYPLRADALWLPAILGTAVVAWRALDPDVPVLSAIALLAPVVTAAALVLRTGPGRASVLAAAHVASRLPRMSGELALFLSAGVLAVGLSAAFTAADLALPVATFDAGVAALALLAVALAAAAGLHPIVSLTALVPLLQPLDPRPETLVLLFVAGWSIGCALCPYSGTNLVLQARHAIPAWRFPVWNAVYAAFMWLAASLAFALMPALP